MTTGISLYHEDVALSLWWHTTTCAVHEILLSERPTHVIRIMFLRTCFQGCRGGEL